ncbi:MAG: response regulator [Terriglobales bacterium]|jgi:CheY-like chemotaxis protein
MHISQVDLSKMAQRVIDEFRGDEPNRNVEVHIGPGLEVQGGPGLPQVVLQNLLSNAWKFTSRREHALIEIDRVKDRPETAFFVRDNGAGFDMQYANQLFTRFTGYTLMRSSKAAVSDWRRCDGFSAVIMVGFGRKQRKDRAQPSTLRLILDPNTVQSWVFDAYPIGGFDGAAARSHEGQMTNERFERLRNEASILLVEDDPDHLELAMRALEKHGVMNNVLVARDGAQALDYLIGGRLTTLPEVVLLDLKLSKVSGLEVLRRIRENEETRVLPVVILTSSDEEQDLVRSYELGVNSYIRKPVSFVEFAEAIRQLGAYWLVLNLSPQKKRA